MNKIISYCPSLYFILLCIISISCAENASQQPNAGYTTSLTDMPGKIESVKEEMKAYKPIKWEIKWASRRVFDFDSAFNKVCKTEFSNPYRKSIKQIKVAYEVKYKNRSEAIVHEKVIQLHLKPNEKKVIDAGIGCRDFYMYEVEFEDGEVI